MSPKRKGVEPFVPQGIYHLGSLEEVFVILMGNVEKALLMIGAQPGVDYTRRDLLVAATPLVLSMFERNPDTLDFDLLQPD